MAVYFAYGSNMDPAQMAERCPGAWPLGAAWLPGCRLTFDRFSARRQGYVADIVPASSAAVWGVAWKVTAAHLDLLDGYEGVSGGAYRRTPVALVGGDGAALDAVAYVVCQPEPPGPPSPAYLGHLLRGARAFALPEWYRRFLAGFAGADDRAR